MLFTNLNAFDSLKKPSYYVPSIKCQNEDFPTEEYWILNYLFK